MPASLNDKANFFSNVLLDPIFQRTGILFDDQAGDTRTIGDSSHWVVIDPGAHAMRVWRVPSQDVAYNYYATTLRASVFSNGCYVRSPLGSARVLVEYGRTGYEREAEATAKEFAEWRAFGKKTGAKRGPFDNSLANEIYDFFLYGTHYPVAKFLDTGEAKIVGYGATVGNAFADAISILKSHWSGPQPERPMTAAQRAAWLTVYRQFLAPRPISIATRDSVVDEQYRFDSSNPQLCRYFARVDRGTGFSSYRMESSIQVLPIRFWEGSAISSRTMCQSRARATRSNSFGGLHRCLLSLATLSPAGSARPPKTTATWSAVLQRR